MKEIKMYAFYDKKSERYDTPFFTYDKVGAKRHFIMSVNREGTLMNTFKDDYELYHILDFNIDTAEVNIIEKKSVIMEGKEVAQAIRESEEKNAT